MHNPGVYQTLTQPDVLNPKLFTQNVLQFFFSDNPLSYKNLAEGFGFIFLDTQEMG